jgi:opacity protein-like surface antigen
MHTRWFGAVLLCVVILAPTLALADEGQSSGPSKDEYIDYVCFYGGLNYGGKLFSGGPNQTLDFSNPRTVGVAINFWAPGAISAELDIAYYPAFFGPSSNLGDNDLITATGSLMVHPYTGRMGSQRVRPYFVVGGGLMRSKIEDFAILGRDVKNTGVVHVGGGVQYFFHPRIGVRGDFRYFKGVGANNSEEGWGWLENWNFFRATVGVAFTF